MSLTAHGCGNGGGSGIPTPHVALRACSAPQKLQAEEVTEAPDGGNVRKGRRGAGAAEEEPRGQDAAEGAVGADGAEAAEGGEGGEGGDGYDDELMADPGEVE
jgi:hypothetical protein